MLLATVALAFSPVAQAADLGHLRKLAGQYTDVLMRDPALDAELHLVLGDGYAGFMTVMQVVFPSTLIDGRYLVAEGCRQHDCGDHRGLIVIDLDAGVVSTFRRDGGVWPAPVALRDYLDVLGGIDAP